MTAVDGAADAHLASRSRRRRVRAATRRAGGPDPARAVRAGRDDRLQVGAGRGDRGGPPVRGADPRRDPAARIPATGSSPRSPGRTTARARHAHVDGRQRGGRGGRGRSPHGRTWIVDPLDGTVNYANGIPYFCVSVGARGRRTAGRSGRRPRPDARRDVLGDRGRTRRCSASDRRSTPREKETLTDFVISLALGGRAVATRARAVRKAIRASRNTGSAALGARLRRERAVRRVRPDGRHVRVGRGRGRADRGARRARS